MLVPAALYPTAAGAQIFEVGDHIELPQAAAGDADHATVAMNEDGDVLVVWQAARTDLPGAPKQVEAVFIPHLGGNDWELPQLATHHFVLGDPEADAIPGATLEANRKPDVVAMGRDFVVTWPRAPQGESLSQLEVVQIEVNGGTAVLRAPAPGQGWIVDPAVEAGDAGVMPDLFTQEIQRDQAAGVVYVHELWAAPPLREYDLRACVLDFGTYNGTPRIVGPVVLQAALPLDDDAAGGLTNGGLVLPDAEEDDFGNLVVAFEEYVRAGHQGAVQDEGSIVVQRWHRGDSGPELIDEIRVFGRDPVNRQRRPNIMGSFLDFRNAVSLTHMDLTPGQTDGDTVHVELIFEGGPNPGTITLRNLLYPNDSLFDDIMPVPVHATEMRMSMAIREPMPGRQMVSWYPTNSTVLWNVTTLTADPYRPAVDVLEFGNPGDPGSRFVPLAYEGPDTAGQGHIYLVINLF